MHIKTSYTRMHIGAELKYKVLHKHSIQEISSWAYSLYLNTEDREREVDSVLMSLGGMDCGEEGEFDYSYERLSEIADDLIAGWDVNLNY